MQRGRNHPGHHRRTQRTDHRPEARQVGMNTHSHPHPHTPEGETLKKAIRILNHIITATHHLQNVMHSTGAPAGIARKTQELIKLIKPAQPTEKTTDLLRGNSLNWEYNTTLILEKHYTEALDAKKLELSHCLTVDLEKAFSIAKKWAIKNLGKRLKSNTLEKAHNLIQSLRAEARLDSPPHPPPSNDPPPSPSPALTPALPQPSPPRTAVERANDHQQPTHTPNPPSSPPTSTPPGTAGARANDSEQPSTPLSHPPIPPSPPVLPLPPPLHLPTPPPPPQRLNLETRNPDNPNPNTTSRNNRITVEAQVLRGASPPNQTGLLDLSRENFPDLTRPQQKTPPQKSPRTRRTNAQQNTESPSQGPSQNTSQPLPQRAGLRSRMVPKVVLNRLETTTWRNPQHTGTEPAQSGANSRERETVNTNSSATTSTQGGTDDQETSPPNQPRCNPAPDGKKANWTLEPTQSILIIGDSNLAKITTYTQENLQIESYPGMRFDHVGPLLEKTNRNEKVSHCIISVGINDRGRSGMDHTKKAINRSIKEAKNTFPCASIIIPLINYSTRLSPGEKQQLDRINQEISKKLHIPKLEQTNFKTKPDNIHWLPTTGDAILAHWLCCLN